MVSLVVPHRAYGFHAVREYYSLRAAETGRESATLDGQASCSATTQSKGVGSSSPSISQAKVHLRPSLGVLLLCLRHAVVRDSQVVGHINPVESDWSMNDGIECITKNGPDHGQIDLIGGCDDPASKSSKAFPVFFHVLLLSLRASNAHRPALVPAYERSNLDDTKEAAEWAGRKPLTLPLKSSLYAPFFSIERF